MKKLMTLLIVLVLALSLRHVANLKMTMGKKKILLSKTSRLHPTRY